MFGLSQYDAALKLIGDFTLPVDAKGSAELSVQEKERIRREKTERERITRIQERFEKPNLFLECSCYQQGHFYSV